MSDEAYELVKQERAAELRAALDDATVYTWDQAIAAVYELKNELRIALENEEP